MEQTIPSMPTIVLNIAYSPFTCLLLMAWQEPLMGQEPHFTPHKDFPFFLSRRMPITMPATAAISIRLMTMVARLPIIQFIKDQLLCHKYF